MAGGDHASDRGFEEVVKRRDDDVKDSKREVVEAYAAYLVIIAIFALAQLGPIKPCWPTA
jgi:lactate permease